MLQKEESYQIPEELPHEEIPEHAVHYLSCLDAGDTEMLLIMKVEDTSLSGQYLPLDPAIERHH